jgi:hypothetical protein
MLNSNELSRPEIVELKEADLDLVAGGELLKYGILKGLLDSGAVEPTHFASTIGTCSK